MLKRSSARLVADPHLAERLILSKLADEFGTSRRAVQCDLENRLAFLELKASDGGYSLDPVFKQKHANSLGKYLESMARPHDETTAPLTEIPSFEIVVIGTMSAGKSTFLNALAHGAAYQKGYVSVKPI
jgi:tRNA U34 5-carboxymethylaminomethyl modifying GTPase MnmE/TrmE